MTIRGKLTLMALTVMVLILLMTGITNFRTTNMFNSILNSEGLNDTELLGKKIKDNLDAVANLVTTVGGSLQYGIEKQSMRRIEAQYLLTQVLANISENNRDGEISELFFGWEDNGRISDAHGWSTPPNYDARERPWYKDAKESPKGQVVFSEINPGSRTNSRAVIASLALYDSMDNLLGVAACDINFKKMADLIVNRELLGDTGFSVILSKSGTVIAHPTREFEFKVNAITGNEISGSKKAIAQKMVAGETGFADYDYGDGKRGRTYYTPIGYGFYLGRFCPISNISNKVFLIITILFSTAIAIILLTGIISFIIVRNLTQSINNMDSVSAQIAKGDFTARYDENGGDELAGIAVTLNNTVSSITLIMNKILSESNTTAVQADTLSVLAGETFASMEEVTSSVARVNNSIDKTTSSVDSAKLGIKEIALSANSSAQSATKGAENAGEMVSRARDAMERVNEIIRDIESIHEMSCESVIQTTDMGYCVDAISDLTSTIKKISEHAYYVSNNTQLAMGNVVDESIKDELATILHDSQILAYEAGTNIREITKLIDLLRVHSSKSVKSTEETMKLLSNALRTSERIQLNMDTALTVSEELSSSIEVVLAVSEEQAAVSLEMSESMSNIAVEAYEIQSSIEIIHASSIETTKAAETIATTAQRLSLTSHKLQKLVNMFKIS